MKHNNKYHPVAHAVKYAIATTFALGIVSGTVVAQETGDTATKEQKIEKIAVVGSRSAPVQLATPRCQSTLLVAMNLLRAVVQTC